MWLTNSFTISRDKAVTAVLASQPQYVATQSAVKRRQSPETKLVGWGNKPSTKKSRSWADNLSLPYHQLEDAFIAYITHPALGADRLGIIHDKQGIYYDARQPCDLDDHLDTLILDKPMIHRCQSLIASLCQYGISKYNQAQGISEQQLAVLKSDSVVIIDQTDGDASITGALADNNDFIIMLEKAIADNPDKTIYLKVHPDVILGKKKGILFNVYKDYPSVQLLPQNITNQQLFSITGLLYTVSSQMGFEAIWYDCHVNCFGLPFYAGRGLTIDHKQSGHSKKPVTKDVLVYAALILYCRYIHPETQQLCDIEDILPFIIQRKIVQQRYHYPTIYAVGFSLWKRLFLSSWLEPMAETVIFCRFKKALALANDDDAILLWSNNHRHLAHPSIIRVEDGFIRSQGLGIDLTPPLSLIFDTQGIYFDATKPSDLEYLLQHLPVSEAQCQRTSALIERIKQNSISKYNLSRQPIASDLKGRKKCILVPGQVESDASIKYGAMTTIQIADILKTARLENPEAFIIYRPHPDVLTGERKGLCPEKARIWADYIDTNSDIHSSIEQADEVHVLTSLVGFEALLRSKRVVCYGQPFYSGWGLTDDKNQHPGRTRKRTLHEICYIILIVYPRYLHPRTGLDSTPEAIINYLVSRKKLEGNGNFPLMRLTKKIARVAALIVNRINYIARYK